MGSKTNSPYCLTTSFTVARQDVMDRRDPRGLIEELREREVYCRRDLGMKLLEHLDLDQAMTVRLRRHWHDDHHHQAVSVTFDLELMAVQTMRVVMREFEPRPVEYREPRPEPKPKPKPPSLWQRYCHYIDAVRGSLGG